MHCHLLIYYHIIVTIGYVCYSVCGQLEGFTYRCVVIHGHSRNENGRLEITQIVLFHCVTQQIGLAEERGELSHLNDAGGNKILFVQVAKTGRDIIFFLDGSTLGEEGLGQWVGFALDQLALQGEKPGRAGQDTAIQKVMGKGQREDVSEGVLIRCVLSSQCLSPTSHCGAARGNLDIGRVRKHLSVFSCRWWWSPIRSEILKR